jgi:hypothetical protein
MFTTTTTMSTKGSEYKARDPVLSSVIGCGRSILLRNPVFRFSPLVTIVRITHGLNNTLGQNG